LTRKLAILQLLEIWIGKWYVELTFPSNKLCCDNYVGKWKTQNICSLFRCN
jgi:hypothetical protein